MSQTEQNAPIKPVLVAQLESAKRALNVYKTEAGYTVQHSGMVCEFTYEEGYYPQITRAWCAKTGARNVTMYTAGNLDAIARSIRGLATDHLGIKKATKSSAEKAKIAEESAKREREAIVGKLKAGGMSEEAILKMLGNDND